MLSQNDMERELYEGRLKEKRDRQTLETRVATAIRERDEVARERDEAARKWDEARRRATKLGLMERVQLCERVLRRPVSDPEQLLGRTVDDLRQLAEQLEQELPRPSE